MSMDESLNEPTQPANTVSVYELFVVPMLANRYVDTQIAEGLDFLDMHPIEQESFVRMAHEIVRLQPIPDDFDALDEFTKVFGPEKGRHVAQRLDREIQAGIADINLR